GVSLPLAPCGRRGPTARSGTDRDGPAASVRGTDPAAIRGRAGGHGDRELRAPRHRCARRADHGDAAARIVPDRRGGPAAAGPGEGARGFGECLDTYGGCLGLLTRNACPRPPCPAAPAPAGALSRPAWHATAR